VTYENGDGIAHEYDAAGNIIIVAVAKL